MVVVNRRQARRRKSNSATPTSSRLNRSVNWWGAAHRLRRKRRDCCGLWCDFLLVPTEGTCSSRMISYIYIYIYRSAHRMISYHTPQGFAHPESAEEWTYRLWYIVYTGVYCCIVSYTCCDRGRERLQQFETSSRELADACGACIGMGWDGMGWNGMGWNGRPIFVGTPR